MVGRLVLEGDGLGRAPCLLSAENLRAVEPCLGPVAWRRGGSTHLPASRFAGAGRGSKSES